MNSALSCLPQRVQSALWPSVEEAHEKKVHTQEEAIHYLSWRLSPNQCRMDDPMRTQYYVQRKNREDTARDVLHRLLIPHIAVRTLQFAVFYPLNSRYLSVLVITRGLSRSLLYSVRYISTYSHWTLCLVP